MTMPADSSNSLQRHEMAYGIGELVPYINWAYFYHAWQLNDCAEQLRMRGEAADVLDMLAERGYRAHAVFVLADANADGDDILMGGVRLPMLRQQCVDGGGHCLCLADFVRPLSSGQPDRVGAFATTVDMGLEADFDGDDYMKMMVQLLADRLAEAAAERMHEQVRKVFWGYAPDERLTVEELHRECFTGIRPAVGYPSLPDASINFLLSDMLGMARVGIRLTGSGAMKPHASVSGLMMAHPRARYFAVGRIGEDQLADYARRRGLPVEVMRRFLMSNLKL